VTEASPIAGSAYQPLSLGSVIIQDTFWAPRIMRVREITLPLQHRLLRDTGRLDALRLDWRPGSKPVPHIFWDSDVAKWVEAASYSLATAPDETLGRQVDEAIELLAGAQQTTATSIRTSPSSNQAAAGPTSATHTSSTAPAT